MLRSEDVHEFAQQLFNDAFGSSWHGQDFRALIPRHEHAGFDHSGVYRPDAGLGTRPTTDGPRYYTQQRSAIDGAWFTTDFALTESSTSIAGDGSHAGHRRAIPIRRRSPTSALERGPTATSAAMTRLLGWLNRRSRLAGGRLAERQAGPVQQRPQRGRGERDGVRLYGRPGRQQLAGHGGAAGQAGAEREERRREPAVGLRGARFRQPDSPRDEDVYSFKAVPGTEVWLDLGPHRRRLDASLELLDTDGEVLALPPGPAAADLSGLAYPVAEDPLLVGDFYTPQSARPRHAARSARVERGRRRAGHVFRARPGERTRAERFAADQPAFRAPCRGGRYDHGQQRRARRGLPDARVPGRPAAVRPRLRRGRPRTTTARTRLPP